MDWLTEPHYVRWNCIKNLTQRQRLRNSGERSKALNEVKPVKNINKNLLRFLEKKTCAKGSPPSYKLQDHAYE